MIAVAFVNFGRYFLFFRSFSNHGKVSLWGGGTTGSLAFKFLVASTTLCLFILAYSWVGVFDIDLESLFFDFFTILSLSETCLSESENFLNPLVTVEGGFFRVFIFYGLVLSILRVFTFLFN